MGGIAQEVSLAATLTFAFFPAVGLWLMWLVSKGRLMRCPETSAVALVSAEARPGRHGSVACQTVTHCDLWPRNKGCAQGCLERFAETTPALQRINLEALRTFERL
jgi:hypothetical protein